MLSFDNVLNIVPSFGFLAGPFTLFYLILAILVAGALYIAYSVFVNSKIDMKEQEVEETLSKISQEDSSWDEGELKEFVEETFYKVRTAILEKKLNELKTMLHPTLYTKWTEQVQVLQIEPEQRSESLSVEQVEIVDVKNYKDDEKDVFTASVGFDGPEYTVRRNGDLKMVYQGENRQDEDAILLIEYWTFERENNQWALLDVNRQESWRKFIGTKVINEE